ncbi:hypothetical protein N7481_004812 [Penicillium waksmanii]|uniref:uncharacterized protein n=1 Tax=Penicillium waksmanii TaxID=69791 RepID=UPI002547A0B5|nr:uncharacterized protein N7481_004812 [Penicillium waksmanii]KAJ5989602.1 hypothetical protein N7481_004812 [Penicillium waksmanii]
MTNIWACLFNYFRKPGDVGVETFSIGYGRNSTRGVDVESLHFSLGYIKQNMLGRHTIMQVEVGKDPVDALGKLEKEMRYSLTELPVPFVICPLYGMMAIGPYVRFYVLHDPDGTLEELKPATDGSAWHIRHDDKAVDSIFNWLFDHFIY